MDNAADFEHLEEDDLYGGYSEDFADEVYVEAAAAPKATVMSPIKRTETFYGDTEANHYEEYDQIAQENSLFKERSRISFKLEEADGSVISLSKMNNQGYIEEQDGGNGYSWTTKTGVLNSFYNFKQGLSTSVNSTSAVGVTTQCDILCTTNTVINYVIEKVPPLLQDAKSVLPYKGRRINRLTHWKIGETPWQKYKMVEAKIERNNILKEERDNFMIRLKYEQEEREELRSFFASRIQALYRGVAGRKRLDKRRMRPIPYKPRKKAAYKVVQSEIQDELCSLASVLNLAPIPGLCLISRSKASRRMRKIQLAASLRIQKFFKMIVARAIATRKLDHLKYVKIHSAARTIARFFKSLKMRTFAHRCKMEKHDRAVRKLQLAARKYIAMHRVRLRRRYIIRYRRMRDAAIVIQRSMKRVFWHNAKKLLIVMNIAQIRLMEETLMALINQGVNDFEIELMENFTLDITTERLIAEEIQNVVNVEEEARIAVHLQKLEEDMRRREKERLDLEEQIRLQEEAERVTRAREAAEQQAKKLAAEREAAEQQAKKLAAEHKEVVSFARDQETAQPSEYSNTFAMNSLEVTAAEMSAFYVSEGIFRSRPKTPQLVVAEAQIRNVLSAARQSAAVLGHTTDPVDTGTELLNADPWHALLVVKAKVHKADFGDTKTLLDGI